MKTKDHPLCFYCGALVTKNAKGDHFPIPKNAGGDLTVRCCISCHDMKDRFNLASWPADWLARIWADFPKLNRETKLFLAKVLRFYAEIVAEQSGYAPGSGVPRPPRGYESKFAQLIKMCEGAEKGTTIVIASPEALGDTFGEVIESLRRLAGADLTLRIARDEGAC